MEASNGLIDAIIVTGPVGAGKSTVAAAVSDVLAEIRVCRSPCHDRPG